MRVVCRGGSELAGPKPRIESRRMGSQKDSRQIANRLQRGGKRIAEGQILLSVFYPSVILFAIPPVLGFLLRLKKENRDREL